MASSQMDLTLGAAGVTMISERPKVLQQLDKGPLSTPIRAREALETGKGALGTLMPLDLIGSLAYSKRTGLLTLERDTISKEAYFVDGHPIFVASNDPQERFGQFLLLRGIGGVGSAMFTVSADRRVARGFFAFRRLAQESPLMWPALPILYFPGSGWIGPKVYAWVARNRHRLGCESEVCELPPQGRRL